MNPFFQFKKVLILVSVLLVSACSSLPQNLESESPNLISDYQQWLDSDSSNTLDVRLGGIIAKVTNLDDKTRLEVVNMPISSAGKPDLGTEPNGRFVAYVDGFLDPVAYAEGRLITVLGTSNGTEQAKVGEFEHQFPVMNARGVHLWRIQERVIVNDVGSYYFPCRGLYCRQTMAFPSEGRVIQEVK
ncbi:Slp family lipoprotein [Vibrio sp. SCSIO 43135]|uniref:Slp family lipoprotein n=1 Tax=Vibrio paucivorans TaxID=2829489 RepID=A0A9X3HSU9_9VIBR|nr:MULTISPECIES: Slp family lipoprotein [Vibrio]MCW8335124.1 Slp family lipoprotein [Vibrio paucivorans]USD42031.1 Slp family lipoprotein [Vibrio sp. SCSIO 43135]